MLSASTSTASRQTPAWRPLSGEVCTRARADDVYLFLTQEKPAAAIIDSDLAFDRHIFAAVTAIAVSEAHDGNVAGRLGLNARQLQALMARWFPHALSLIPPEVGQRRPNDDEYAVVHDLLMAHRCGGRRNSRWLAAIVARRAMEPHHLWEDLGLRDRAELSRLLVRYFAPLATRNTRNMRWKRFFYRVLCESDGLVMCKTPSCSGCDDFDDCFGEETGESRLARARLASDRAAA